MKKIVKAGIVPYIVRNGVLRMCFMTPSDPDFGGDRPQVAKGNVDEGETTEVAALREGFEELGLLAENVVSTEYLLTHDVASQSGDTFSLALYAAEVKFQHAFGVPHYETKEVSWFTMEEFARWGRESHVKLVQTVYEFARGTH